MHVVYAMRPRSDAFRDNVGAPSLEQAELDGLLREHALRRPKAAARAAAREVMAWLLEEGASLEVLCAHDDFATRAAAAQVLAGLSGEAAARAAQLLGSSDWRARATAAEAMGMLPASDVEPHLKALAGLLEDDEALARMAATAALGKVGSVAALHCAGKLESTRPRGREAAAEVLGKIGPAASDHADALAELLQDGDWQVPTAAANALTRIGAAAAPSCAAVLARCSPVARAAAAEALARIGGEAGAAAAAGLLRAEDPGVRRHAAEALGATGPGHGAPHRAALAALCGDQDKDVRKAALAALVRLGVRPELPSVEGNGDALPEGVGRGGSHPERRRRSRSRHHDVRRKF